MTEYIVALTTCPETKGQDLAHILIEKQVCACVNVFPRIKSYYFWKKEIVEDSEVLLLMKTEAKFEEILRDTIIQNHPYELPEFVVFDIKSGSKDYLEWISTNLAK